ncbi:MAG: hypothetical protein DRJ03_19385 [Chloroflexi bacterium]|nr:MAG: hypothetical protein DRJ03_19385 [Chloroflexota bacterium]
MRYLDHPFDVRTLTSRRPTPSEFVFYPPSVPPEVRHVEITEKTEITEIDTLIEKMYRINISNTIQNTIAFIAGRTNKGFKHARITAEGAIYVTPVGGGFDRNETKAGNAPDSYGSAIPFSKECGRVDVFVFDNAALLKRSRDGVTWDDEFELPADSFYSFDATTKEFKIKNKTAGSTARYSVVGWYKD